MVRHVTVLGHILEARAVMSMGGSCGGVQT